MVSPTVEGSCGQIRRRRVVGDREGKIHEESVARLEVVIGRDLTISLHTA